MNLIPFGPDRSWSHMEANFTAEYGNKDGRDEAELEHGRFLIDNPGKWDCMLRDEGKPIRQFLFTVNKDGMIQHDEMQTGKRPITTYDGSVLVDVRIAKDSTVDKRIRPDVMKKGLSVGLPWPDHAKVKAVHAAFPPKR